MSAGELKALMLERSSAFAELAIEEAAELIKSPGVDVHSAD